MVKQIAILVEGQTEEAFVNRILRPYVGDSVYLTPIIVHTSRSADGTAQRGGGSWKHYHRHLSGLLRQSHWTRVTTLLDFYGYPKDAPRCTCIDVHRQPICVESREAAIRSSFPSDDRFFPFIALHEFETIVIAAGATSDAVLGDSRAAVTFRALVSDHDGNAELINDGPATAPSKRVTNALPGYSKVRDSVAILERSFDAALEATPRLRNWARSLRQ